jgi:hypothetical protein
MRATYRYANGFKSRTAGGPATPAAILSRHRRYRHAPCRDFPCLMRLWPGSPTAAARPGRACCRCLTFAAFSAESAAGLLVWPDVPSARDRATLLMTMPAVIPMIKITGSGVPIGIICGRVDGKVDTKASAIRGVTVIICRIGVGSRVPRVGSACRVAPLRGRS